jgi:hypothetical protein
MSFLDDIVDVATSVVGFIGGWGTVATVAASYVLHEVTNSTKPAPANDSPSSGGGGAASTVDPGVRQQIAANSANKIPVVYGHAILGGKVFDAVISDDNTTMWFALAICEKTREFTLANEWVHGVAFENIYWQGKKCVFGYGSSDYNSVTALADVGSSTTQDISNGGDSPLKIYLYNNGSNGTTVLRQFWSPGNSTGDGQGPRAMDIMPNWTEAHTANELVFAIVQIKYNKTLGITGLGDLKFEITNPLNQPGDVLFDYMTNTRYGAGIDAADIAQ